MRLSLLVLAGLAAIAAGAVRYASRPALVDASSAADAPPARSDGGASPALPSSTAHTGPPIESGSGDVADAQVAALVAAAASDPDGAIRGALALAPEWRRKVGLRRLAAALVARDARGAFDRAARIDDPQARAELETALWRAWAERDPQAMLDTVMLDPDPERRMDVLANGAIEAFFRIEPAHALELSGELPSGMSAVVRRAALRSLTRVDPLAVLRYAEALPPSAERDETLRTVAAAYAEVDAEAALVWAQSLQPPAEDLMRSILGELARVQPERAIDLAFSASEVGAELRNAQALIASGHLEAHHAAAIADRIRSSPRSRGGLKNFLSAWARDAPEDALQWLLASGVRTPGTFAQIGQSFGRTSPAAAADHLARVPSELRGEWLAAVADGYAAHDAEAAAEWVARYRGQPGYEAAIAAVARRVAQSDASPKRR